MTVPEKLLKDQTPGNRDIKLLKTRVKQLDRKKAEALDDAICDLIDMKGYSLAVLLKNMSELNAKIQVKVARKIEDFLFFHPENGVGVFDRLVDAVGKSHEDCAPSLISAVADVASATLKTAQNIGRLGEPAHKILVSDTDFLRKAKAVEIVARAGAIEAVPDILSAMSDSIERVDRYENYSFLETCLFAIKKLGGEGLLRLLVNPASSDAARQLRMEWRNKGGNTVDTVLQKLKGLDPEFSAFVLKIVDLSEFGVPFVAMVHEGLSHADKWIRQSSVAAMSKLSDAQGLESLHKMLSDKSLEVRLMAISSLGSFPPELSGEILANLAASELESLELRLNAIYALLSQKNISALASLVTSENKHVSIHAQGGVALLLPKEEGFSALLKVVKKAPLELLRDLFHYLNEVSQPDDLKTLIREKDQLDDHPRRTVFLEFIAAFLAARKGSLLEKAISELSPGERKAIEALLG